MSPFDEDPAGNRSELDLCIDEIDRLQSQLTAAETKIAEFEDDIIRFNEICVKKTRGLEAKLKIAVELIEKIERISCGEDQVADDDSEGMGVIYKLITKALNLLN